MNMAQGGVEVVELKDYGVLASVESLGGHSKNNNIWNGDQIWRLIRVVGLQPRIVWDRQS